jgi:hypothetical protein
VCPATPTLSTAGDYGGVGGEGGRNLGKGVEMANWAADSWARGGQERVRVVSARSHLQPKTGSWMGARGRPHGPGSGWVGPLGAGFSACLSGRIDTDPRCPFGSAR